MSRVQVRVQVLKSPLIGIILLANMKFSNMNSDKADSKANTRHGMKKNLPMTDAWLQVCGFYLLPTINVDFFDIEMFQLLHYIL